MFWDSVIVANCAAELKSPQICPRVSVGRMMRAYNKAHPHAGSDQAWSGSADETQLGLSCGFLGRRGSLHTACEQLPIYGADDRIEICGFREIVIHFGSNAAHCGFKSRICGQENCHAIGIGFSHGVDDGESIAFSVNVEVWSDSRTSNL